MDNATQDKAREKVPFGDIENVAVLKALSPSELGHELFNPLAAIQALSEILRDNPDMKLEQRQLLLNKIFG